MGYSVRTYARGFSPSNYFPKGVKWLLIINCAVFVLQYILNRTSLEGIFDYFALVPTAVLKLFFVWQVVTYMFLHGGFFHLLFNMFSLWMFGRTLEETWGTKKFLQLYFFCGIGAGIFVVILQYLFGNPNVPTIGSSGAIYGVMMAFAVLYPTAIIYFYVFPIQARWFVLIVGAIAFLSSFKNINSPVSDIAHSSGLLLAWVFLKTQLQTKRRVAGVSHPSMIETAQQRYKQWKLDRAKKKFQVYLKKHGSDRNDMIH
jgi:membrane associated rhomboid family serine protease